MNWKNARKKMFYLLSGLASNTGRPEDLFGKREAQMVADAYNQGDRVNYTIHPKSGAYEILVTESKKFSLIINYSEVPGDPNSSLGDNTLAAFKTANFTLTVNENCFPNVCPEVHYVYRLGFLNARGFDADVQIKAVMESGYVGMTSREPFTRLKEHFGDAQRGTGSLLHRYWAAAAEVSPGTFCNMTMIAVCKTRDAAFDVEEGMVDYFATKYPGGLNVISGGKKGMRELWEHGLGGQNMSVAERDQAAAKLFGGRVGHYRVPHVRNQWFPSEQTHRKIMISGTYVKPSAPPCQ